MQLEARNIGVTRPESVRRTTAHYDRMALPVAAMPVILAFKIRGARLRTLGAYMTDWLGLLLILAMAVILFLVVRTQQLSSQVQQRAMSQFEAWQAGERKNVRLQEAEVARREARADLERWKVAAEGTIRADAVQRSRSVIAGRVTEHVVPYLPSFTFNPKDARFLGSPIDFVVFDGLDQGRLDQVVFIEVKTGTGSLTSRERQIRDSILGGRVRWQELKLDGLAGEADVDLHGEQFVLKQEHLTPDRAGLGFTARISPSGGIEIGQVHADSRAARAGLRSGDVIMFLGRQPVGSIEELEELARSSGLKARSLGVKRGGKYVTLELDA